MFYEPLIAITSFLFHEIISSFISRGIAAQNLQLLAQLMPNIHDHNIAYTRTRHATGDVRNNALLYHFGGMNLGVALFISQYKVHK